MSAELGAGSWLQGLVALGVVLGLLWGAAKLAKRAGNGAFRPTLLRAVSSVSVGPRERVVVVEVGSKWIVVGVAPGNVRALHVMDPVGAPDGGR